MLTLPSRVVVELTMVFGRLTLLATGHEDALADLGQFSSRVRYQCSGTNPYRRAMDELMQAAGLAILQILRWAICTYTSPNILV